MGSAEMTSISTQVPQTTSLSNVALDAGWHRQHGAGVGVCSTQVGNLGHAAYNLEAGKF